MLKFPVKYIWSGSEHPIESAKAAFLARFIFLIDMILGLAYLNVPNPLTSGTLSPSPGTLWSFVNRRSLFGTRTQSEFHGNSTVISTVLWFSVQFLRGVLSEELCEGRFAQLSFHFTFNISFCVNLNFSF